MTRQEIVLGLYREAADLFHVDPAELASKSRLKSVARARHVAVALARARYGWSYPELALAFGKKDHVTMMNSVRWASEHGYVLELEAAAQ